MSDNITRRLISAYYKEAGTTAFISGMFRARPENFYDGEKVEVDIVRSEEDVAIVVQDLSSNHRMNSFDQYTSKEFTAPVLKEGVPLNSYDLIKRMPGETNFQNPNYRANIIKKMFSGMRQIERKFRRSIELQSSQIMQTGAVTLTDSAGASLYALNFQPKAAHFPTAAVTWATATLAQKLGNIGALCDAIRSNGLTSPDQIVFGVDAWENLLSTAGFLDTRYDSRRADIGTITSMESVGEGGIYRGTIEVGNYKLDVYTYDGRYKDPVTGVSTPYMDPGKVIVRSSTARLDATFGGIPHIGRELGATANILPEMPARLGSSAQRMDLHTSVWLSPDGSQLFGGVGSRPLMIPTDIDSYGCLTTQL